MKQPAVVPMRERERVPDITEVFRRFVRLADLPSLIGEDLPIDVEENEKDYRVKVEIPGARKEDVQVRVDGHVLSIDVGAVEPPAQEAKSRPGHRVLINELHHGSRSRTVQLPQEIDEKRVHAAFDNGVLKLTCPKRASARQTLVAIQ
jgi:HSP20 family protein